MCAPHALLPLTVHPNLEWLTARLDPAMHLERAIIMEIKRCMACLDALTQQPKRNCGSSTFSQLPIFKEKKSKRKMLAVINSRHSIGSLQISKTDRSFHELHYATAGTKDAGSSCS